jgi:hypothetical protein
LEMGDKNPTYSKWEDVKVLSLMQRWIPCLHWQGLYQVYTSWFELAATMNHRVHFINFAPRTRLKASI